MSAVARRVVLPGVLPVCQLGWAKYEELPHPVYDQASSLDQLPLLVVRLVPPTAVT